MPQYVDFILSSVVDSESIIDSCTSAIPYAMCDHCVNHNAKGNGKACQKREDEDDMWLLNSGASAHFTFNFDAFVEYHQYAKPCHSQTVNSLAPVLGEGIILIQFNGNIVQLLPTIYMPTCTFQLTCISLGTLLKNNCLYAQSAEGYMGQGTSSS